MPDSIAEIGRIIGNLSKEQSTIKENISADETETQDTIYASFVSELQCTGIINKLTYPTDSFILDHPIYGELDSSVLKLDGGYDPSVPTEEVERQLF